MGLEKSTYFRVIPFFGFMLMTGSIRVLKCSQNIPLPFPGNDESNSDVVKDMDDFLFTEIKEDPDPKDEKNHDIINDDFLSSSGIGSESNEAPEDEDWSVTCKLTCYECGQECVGFESGVEHMSKVHVKAAKIYR